MVYKITSYDSAPVFLTRPRRFGKSLLVSVFESLFKNGLKHFQGLAIADKWKENRNYRVVHLDFSVFAQYSADAINRGISLKLINVFDDIQAISKGWSTGEFLNCTEILLKLLDKSLINDSSAVLLIDEYDAPVIHAMNDPQRLSEITNLLSSFFATVKSCERLFRFVFITGITRLANIKLLSEVNNYVDISFNPEFAEITGITDDELHKYFDPYVQNAASVLNMTVPDVYSKMKRIYDGYQFSIAAQTTLYNPWSIINFLATPANSFKHYWFSSNGATPTLLVNHLLKNSFPDDYGQIKKDRKLIQTSLLEQKSEITSIPSDLLLTQTGYYSLRRIGNSENLAELVFPNEEVEESVIELIETMKNLRMSSDTALRIDDNLISYIDDENIEGIVQIFNAILNECLGPNTVVFNSENDVRDIIYSHINLTKLIKSKEKESLLGYSDMELKTACTRLVIEFKRVETDKDTQKALDAAIEQIRSRRYGEGPYQEKLARVAMAISQEKRSITAFRKAQE